MLSDAVRRLPVYDENALDAVLSRMASQAAQLLRGSERPTVVGILRRGVPLADRLSVRLRRDHGIDEIGRLNLAIKRYADDLSLLYPDTQLVEDPAYAALDLAGHTLLVVDDVLFAGHSLVRALQYLAGKYPRAIRSAVLVDRCTATLPVRADVTGVRLEVAPGDIVECHVPPFEDEFKIELVSRAEGQGWPVRARLFPAEMEFRVF